MQFVRHVGIFRRILIVIWLALSIILTIITAIEFSRGVEPLQRYWDGKTTEIQRTTPKTSNNTLISTCTRSHPTRNGLRCEHANSNTHFSGREQYTIKHKICFVSSYTRLKSPSSIRYSVRLERHSLYYCLTWAPICYKQLCVRVHMVHTHTTCTNCLCGSHIQYRSNEHQFAASTCQVFTVAALHMWHISITHDTGHNQTLSVCCGFWRNTNEHNNNNTIPMALLAYNTLWIGWSLNHDWLGNRNDCGTAGSAAACVSVWYTGKTNNNKNCTIR